MTFARPSGQLSLLSVRPEYRIDGNAHARNAYGAAAQEIVCAALSLLPIPIDGRCDVCFDAECPQTGRQFEIKSVHKGGKMVVYDWRMTKEAAAGDRLLYAMLVHRVRGARSSDAMWNGFRTRGLSILILPAAEVHAVARAYPLKQVKSSRHPNGARVGYNRKGYADGYRNVSLAHFFAIAPLQRTANFLLYDQPFSVDIHRQH